MTSTTITRIIGIDFGTSTSVVCYKDYDKDGPLHKDDAVLICFGGNNTTVPTLVLTDTKGNTSFGDEAKRKGEQYPELLGVSVSKLEKCTLSKTGGPLMFSFGFTSGVRRKVLTCG